MVNKLRGAIFYVVSAIISIPYSLFALTLWVAPRLLRHRLTIYWCHIEITALKYICGVRYEIIGADNIKKAGAPIVALSKHQSAWETFYLQLALFPASTLLKKELLSIPVFGWGLRGIHPIAIDRSNPREALRQLKSDGLAHIREQYNLLIFPEGTRVNPGERKKYARSGADIAIEAGIDVLPIAVATGHCWPAKKMEKHPGTVKVIFGEPIQTEGRTSREVTDLAEQWIEGKMQEIYENS